MGDGVKNFGPKNQALVCPYKGFVYLNFGPENSEFRIQESAAVAMKASDYAKASTG